MFKPRSVECCKCLTFAVFSSGLDESFGDRQFEDYGDTSILCPRVSYVYFDDRGGGNGSPEAPDLE